MGFVTLRYVAIFLALTLITGDVPLAGQTLHVSRLRCAYLENPEGIDDIHPRLGWILESAQRGQLQTAYRVLVASSESTLSANRGDSWDSGKLQSSNTSVDYAGAPLKSGRPYFWKVMAWDRNGAPSHWSETGRFSTGLLHAEDWRGNWIGAEVAEDRRNAVSGYQAQPSPTEDDVKWVTMDLGSEVPIDTVILHPATRLTGLFTPAYGFPIRFRIEGSPDGAFTDPILIADESNKDFPSPGFESRLFPAHGIRARFIRIQAIRLWKDDAGSDVPFRFALGEVEVISGGRDIALNREVTAKDSFEGEGWGTRFLVDGKNKYDPSAAHVGNAAVMFRKEFNTEKKPVRAMAYISGLGYNEVYLNGRRVGDRVLDPGFTDYTKRVYYTTYDVTTLIKSGPNAIGILCGNGWFHLVTEDLFGFEKAPWTAPPQALLDLVLEYKDGSREVIATDASWKWATGPITYNSVRGGETYDARLEKPGWSSIGYKATDWRSVKAVTAPAGHLTDQEEQPIRVVESITPVKFTEPRRGVYLFDLGVNISGWVRFRAKGVRGEKVTLQANERLKPDGTLDAENQAAYHTHGRFQTDELILSGNKEDVFQPRFTYHGFQYVQVTGLTEPPSLADLTGEWVHTDVERTGSFACSNEKLNRIQAAILRTQLNYIVGFPSDPLREKMGWTQDVFNDFEAGVLNFDVAPLYRRWFHDLLDAQDPDGHEPSIAPTSGWGRVNSLGEPAEFSDVWWGGALVYLPWLWYQTYDDPSLIKEGYPAAQKYMTYLSKHSSGYMIDWGLGDWGDSPWGANPIYTPRKLTTSEGYYYLASILSHEAGLLGKKEESAEYTTLAEHIKQAINREFLDSRSGIYASGSQTAQALPLYVGMIPAEQQSRAVDRLIESVHAADNHLKTGFVGLLPLMIELTESGNTELAYRVATQEDIPGWWNMIKDGESTVSEYWDTKSGSRDIFNLAGPAGLWYYQALAGIRVDPEHPGYRHFLIVPQIVGDLTYAEGRTMTPVGLVRSSWHLKNGNLDLDITVPANSSARVELPISGESDVEADGIPIDQIPEIRSIVRGKDRLTFELSSGDFRLSAPFRHQR